MSGQLIAIAIAIFYVHNALSLQAATEAVEDSSTEGYTNGGESTLKDAKVNDYLDTVCGQVDTEQSKFDASSHSATVLQPGEFPWLAAIYNQSMDFICAGTLISANSILTAAHCLKDPALHVYLGRYNLSDPNEQDSVQRKIDTFIIHPEYKEDISFADADIALLQMLEPVSFTKFIRPICLWNEPSEESLIVGVVGFVAGWGVEEFKRLNRTMSLVPKKLEQDIVSERVCLRSSDAFLALTSERTLCAGKRDAAETSVFDSGSGLVVKRSGRWVLRAVAAGTLVKDGHCDLGEYVVYCDVATHLQWVLNSMVT